MDLCSKTWNVSYETRSIYTNVSTARTAEGYINITLEKEKKKKGAKDGETCIVP